MQAVLEGVALALGDCHAALTSSGATIERIVLTGGGARSALWVRLVSAAVGQPLTLTADRQAGPAIGAARLARSSVGGPLLTTTRPEPEALSTISVDTLLADQLAHKRSRYRAHISLSAAEVG